VAAGRRQYLNASSGGQQRYLLRRNVHMLEKGLSMRPRRDVFATEYIEQTVTTFQTVMGDIAGACETDRELQWANDVLAAYFDAVGAHPAIDRARNRFVKAPLGNDPRSTQDGLSPYARDLTQRPPVEYADLLALAERRRSVRWFEQRPVPREAIERAVLIAGLSPSACNRQPYQFRIFDDPAVTKKVAEIPMGTRGWVDNIPAFVVVVGTTSAFFSERDRHIIYTDGALASMSFVFALESLGLSSCCVNWPDIREREERMARLLDLAPHERPIMCIAIGYPDAAGLVPFSHKRPAAEIVRFNNE
jgi:nitroreductase